MCVMFLLLCRDTAGQERYQTITKQYYRRAQVIPPYLPSLEPGCLHGSWEHSDSNHSFLWTLVQGIIFVYDITNQPSFQHLAKWVSDVDEVSQSALSFHSATLAAPHKPGVRGHLCVILIHITLFDTFS